MAAGGQPWMDEEEGNENFDMLSFRLLAPFVAELKKEGDERFRSKDYQQAASIYLTALNCPIPLFLDVSVVSEQLFRRRAECLFRLGKYLEAIKDSERAIEIADCNNSRNLVKSLFIKMKAIQSLGDYVPALPLAVWCKHLKPCEQTNTALNSLKEKLREEINEDEDLIHEVLNKMIRFSMQMQEDRETLELALECYTELLDLLDFLFLPGVLRKRAECLLSLRRHNEAKNDCMKAIWLRPGDEEALALMHRITQSMRETEERKPKETKQCVQGKEKNSVSSTVDVLKEVAALQQTEDVAAEEDSKSKREKKKKRNKKKKKRKKAKKKEVQQKKENASTVASPVQGWARVLFSLRTGDKKAPPAKKSDL